MNFNLIENHTVDFNEIHDSFCDDYLWSNELSNVEIRKKYDLTVREFKELSGIVKKEFGFKRRPNYRKGKGKYYYRHEYGYSIQKQVKDKFVYLGFVSTEAAAIEVVELCKKVGWDIGESKHIIKTYKQGAI